MDHLKVQIVTKQPIGLASPSTVFARFSPHGVLAVFWTQMLQGKRFVLNDEVFAAIKIFVEEKGKLFYHKDVENVREALEWLYRSCKKPWWRINQNLTYEILKSCLGRHNFTKFYYSRNFHLRNPFKQLK